MLTTKRSKLWWLLAMGLFLGGPAGAATVDEGTSLLQGNDVIDLSGDGVLAFVLDFHDPNPVVLDVAVSATEAAQALGFEAVLHNLTDQDVETVTLSLENGVELATVGAVSRNGREEVSGIASDATSATIPLAGDPRVFLLELGDPIGLGLAAWSLDASGIEASGRFQLRIEPTFVPEPAAWLLLLAAIYALAVFAPRRDHAGGHAAIALLALSLAHGEDAAAKQVIVSNSVDGTFGSLRNAIDTFADPGDTIVFQVNEVVLDDVLEIPPGLPGLTLQGPVTIRPASGLRGVLLVLADDLTITGIGFADVQVSTNELQPVSGLKILGSQLTGQSAIILQRSRNCLVDGTQLDVVRSGLSAPIHLSFTQGCVVSNNTIVSPLRNEIEDDNSEDLIVQSNDLTGGLFSRQRSGAIVDNMLRQVYVVPSDGGPPGTLRIEGNEARFLRVSRSNVDVLRNTVDTQGLVAGLIGIAVSARNVGRTGSFVLDDNTIRGGEIGLLYAEGRDSVPAQILNNDVSGCDDRGMLVRRPADTQVVGNEVRDCGQDTSGAGLQLHTARTAAVVANTNTITGIRGAGIDVVNTQGVVTLQANTVTGCTASGIEVRGGAGVAQMAGNTVTGNDGAGVAVRSATRATVETDRIQGNGDAGVLVFPGALVHISQVSMRDNAGPGIDIFPKTVTPNPAFKEGNDDIDWPEDLRLNVPAMKLEGTALPGSLVEVYRVEDDPRAGNPQNGEGELFLGSVVADATGRFSFPDAGTLDCPAASRLTLTATGGLAEDPFTSEFSPDFACDAPRLDSDGDGVPDDRDDCPDTLLGEAVDERGCSASQRDSDGDGVSDADDRCPDTTEAANADGCAQTVQSGDATVYCNSGGAPCGVGAQGGPCIDCGIALAGILLDCFGVGPSCAVLSVGGARCDDCSVSGPGAGVSCENAACSVPATDGELSCQGPAGGCATDFADGSSTGCAAEKPCTVLIDSDLVRDPLLPHAEVVVEKVTIGGDETFVFGSLTATTDLGEITTMSGAGTSNVRFVQPPNVAQSFDIVVIVGEGEPPDGWTLASIECDFPHTIINNLVAVDLLPGDVATCTFTNVREALGEVRDSRVAMPEGGNARVGSFGLPPGNRIGIAGADGFVIVDALTDEVPFAGAAPLRFQTFVPNFGLLVLQNPLGDTRDAIFAYGPSGLSLRHFDPFLNGFGSVLVGSGNTTDAVHLGGDETQPGAIFVSNGSIVPLIPEQPPPSLECEDSGIFCTRDEDCEMFGSPPGTRCVVPPPRAFFTPGPSIAESFVFSGASGPVITAFRQDQTSSVLAVTDGQPGELYVVEPDPIDPFNPPAVTRVEAVGNDPRRVRCTAGLCAVSNFGSDSLTLVQWSGGAAATIAGTASVGDGPVGIDALAIGQNVAFVSTGFNDDTYHVTVVAPDGSVVSSQSSPAPTGCANPGHAIWLKDPANQIVMTCNGSDAYAVVSSGIPPP